MVQTFRKKDKTDSITRYTDLLCCPQNRWKYVCGISAGIQFLWGGWSTGDPPSHHPFSRENNRPCSWSCIVTVGERFATRICSYVAYGGWKTWFRELKQEELAGYYVCLLLLF